jgi:hypothetical protein
VYSDVRLQNEAESEALKDLHERFDTYYDKDKMADKLPTQWYNLENIDKFDDIEYSTEFTDEENDLIYKRYKMQQHKAKEGILEYAETIENLQREAEQWRPQALHENIEYDEVTGRPISTDPESMLAKFRENLEEKKKINANVMNKIAQMKYEKALRNRDGDEYVTNFDPIFER